MITIISWTLAKLLKWFPTICYIEVWPKHKHKTIGPDNFGGSKVHPAILNWLVKKAGLKVGYVRSSQL